MATPTKFQSWVEYLTEGANVGSDVFKLVLTNVLPVNTNTVLANITQIAGGNGYTTGGNTLTTVSSSQTGGVQRVFLANYPLTASGGAIATWRYGVIIDSTLASSPLVCWVDSGGAQNMASGDIFNFNFDQVNGAFTTA